MNYWLFPTLVLGFLLYGLGMRTGKRSSVSGFNFAFLIGLLAAVPDLVFTTYYFKILGEPIWLYQFRSIPGSELAAAGAGFLAGLLQARLTNLDFFRKIVGSWLFAILLFFSLLGPYLKPLLRPPLWDQFQDDWAGNVCLQTSESSCGPACAATMLRQLGKSANEKQIAQESFTSRQGTENWYLARTLRRHGAQVQFLLNPDADGPWPYPAIAGVRLGNTGHFITIVGHDGDQYVIGDPLGGERIKSQADWRRHYQFTGFFLLVK